MCCDADFDCFILYGGGGVPGGVVSSSENKIKFEKLEKYSKHKCESKKKNKNYLPNVSESRDCTCCSGDETARRFGDVLFN